MSDTLFHSPSNHPRYSALYREFASTLIKGKSPDGSYSLGELARQSLAFRELAEIRRSIRENQLRIAEWIAQSEAPRPRWHQEPTDEPARQLRRIERWRRHNRELEMCRAEISAWLRSSRPRLSKAA